MIFLTHEEQLKQVEILLSENKLDEARSLLDTIEKEKLEQRAKQVEPEKKEEVKEDKQQEEPKEEVKEPEAPKEEPKKEDEEEAEEDKKEPEQRSVEKGEVRKMEKVVLDGTEITKPNDEKRGFFEYVRGGNSKTDLRALPEGVKSSDVGVIIPEDIVTKTRMLPETRVDLRNLVQVLKVNTPIGKYPILNSTEAVMVTVAELEANPDLEKPQFKEVTYDVDTYRGQIPVSKESLDDSDEDLGALIAGHIQRIAVNTANKAIVANLKTAKAETVTNLDRIKTLINTGFDPAYNLQLVVSQSFYNEIDLMKDNEGRYLLQPSITAQSGKALLGLDVTILSDKLLGGVAGAKVAFLGDPAGFTVFFDRKEVAVRWQEYGHYGEILAAAMRFDVKNIDPAAGMFLTLTPGE